MGDVGVVVLDKPRHAELVARLRATGATVRTPSAGDVAGALLALLPGTGVDVLMGVGGTPEGLMTACACGRSTASCRDAWRRSARPRPPRSAPPGAPPTRSSA